MTGSADHRRTIGRLTAFGALTVALLVIGVGGWAMTSRLSGAVIAPGRLVVETSVRKVQHPTGGIIGALLVEEGETVRAGQVLLRIDDTGPRTRLGVIRSELDALAVREARLHAERDGAPAVAFPAALGHRKDEDGIGRAFAGEERLFEARRRALTGQQAQLDERIAQFAEEIRGLEAQKSAAEDQAKIAADELIGIAALFTRKLVPAERKVALERERARLEGQLGQLTADIARVRGRISETDLQRLQLETEFRTRVLDELRDTDARSAELQQRRLAAEDELRRTEVRAPTNGVVHELAVNTVGAVAVPGETLLAVVPQADRLVVDARVSPEDIDQLAVGKPVTVRVLAANQRTTPALAALVARISPDIARDEGTGAAYYAVRVNLVEGPEVIAPLQLRPGIPAEVHFATEERTPLQYLVKPIGEQMARAFRER